MDYRKFLDKRESLVLPYLGGPYVDAPGRRLRMASDEAPAPGWWRFEVTGRAARAVERAEASGLEALPPLRGHLVGGWLVSPGATVDRVWLLPEEEPSALSPCRARRWSSGDLLFDTFELEGDAEEAVRRAVEERLPLDGIRGVSAALRAAYGLAIVVATARAANLRLSPLEARHAMLDVAQGGPRVATELLARLDARRREEALRSAARHPRHRDVCEDDAHRDSRERVLAALTAAGARFFDLRRLAGPGSATASLLEVRYEIRGERFVSIVDEGTLQVLEAGICLAGHDRQLTLESLPSVIMEALDDDELVITRH